ncbi:hypothetical protein DV515_00010892, partial [Chloebia gouldiae]
MQLKRATRMRINAYAVIHIRSHKWEEGLGEGNARADKLVSIVQETPLAKHALAREVHSIFHQNAKGLSKEFKIPLTEAKMLVWACPICSHHNGGQGLGLGVNPRGLQSNELWQMDVTHIAEFGRLKYVHVSLDTYSKFIWATPQVGEKAIHVERHLLSCFAVLGVPKRIKTDNGPAYTSKRIAQFLQTWGVDHVRGIPHSPTGQAIIERAHGTLKRYVEKLGEEHSGYLPDGLNPSSMQNLPLQLTADTRERIRTKASLTLLRLKGNNEHLDQRVDRFLYRDIGNILGYQKCMTGWGHSWLGVGWVLAARPCCHPPRRTPENRLSALR